MRAIQYDPKFTCSQLYFYFYMRVVSLWLIELRYCRQDNWLLLGVDTMGSTADRAAGGVAFDSKFAVIYIQVHYFMAD